MDNGNETMNIQNIDFYFFSGTGNTLLVTKAMVKTFKENGIKTRLFKIEDSKPYDVNLGHVIGLGFPVAELSTYDFIWKFINDLPNSNGTKIFMVDTLAGFSGGIVGSLREILKKKGYNPIGAKEIIMPPNIFYIQDETTSKNKVQKGIKKAEKYAEDIIQGKSIWGRVPLLSDLAYYISITGLKITHSNLNQKLLYLTADREKCNRCGLCVDICPLNNIKIDNEKYPINMKNCAYCMRCTSFCPKKAIKCPLNYKSKTYRAVMAKDLIE